MLFEETWTNWQVLARLRGLTVVHSMDSKAMESIIQKGSSNPKLQPLIMKSILALREFAIEFIPFWKSKQDEVIKWADIGSRDFHEDDVSLD